MRETYDARRASRLKPKAFNFRNKAAENYERQLRKVAKQIGDLIALFKAGDVSQLPALEHAMATYAKILAPWARAAGSAMIAEVNKRDAKAWAEITQNMGAEVKIMLRYSGEGRFVKERLDEQVKLITSLPIDAGKRVHKLTLEGLGNSSRYDEIVKEIMRSGEVSQAQAMTIARTETSRTASLFTESRALNVGSDSYIWHDFGDHRVRKLHHEHNGKVFKWSAPPVIDEHTGKRGHPGTIYNCRCYPEPILPR